MNKQSWARMNRITHTPTAEDNDVLFELVCKNDVCYPHFHNWNELICDSRLKRAIQFSKSVVGKK